MKIRKNLKMIENLIKPLGNQVGNDKQDYVKAVIFEKDGSEKISINGHLKEFTIEEFEKIGFQGDLFKDQRDEKII